MRIHGMRIQGMRIAVRINRAQRGPTYKDYTMPKQASSQTAKREQKTDALALLKADHKEVKDLFKSYDELVTSEADDAEKAAVATQICSMLTVHATIEEEIFYPAARENIDEQDLLDEAEVEHASAKDLIAQIEAMAPGEDLFDAKVKVLGEYVAHHVKEEEDELFPKVKSAKLDLQALGDELALRKQELMAELDAEQAA